MKRIFALLLGAAFLFGSAVQASAIEVELSGEMDFAFGFTDNAGFSKDDVTDHFFARQRARFQVDFIASENLRGVIMLQAGSEDDNGYEWGGEESGYALDTTSKGMYVRRAYIDWNWPSTDVNVKMGLHYMAMPSAVFGNPFWGGEMAGVSVSTAINDNVSFTLAWARPYRNSDNTKTNDMDMFGLFFDFDYEQFAISPWVTYASVGSQSGFWDEGYSTQLRFLDGSGGPFGGGWFDDKSHVYAGGLALTVSPLDNLEIKFDAMYAKLKNDSDSESTLQLIGGGAIPWDAPEGDGWLVALAVDYSLDWGTPGFFAWYASGDDKDDWRDNKFGRMPMLAGDDGFVATRMGNAGAFSIGDDTFIGNSGVGTWGVGLQLAELSFVEDLSHVARIAYYRGTNHKDAIPTVWIGEAVYMTKKDWAFEVNFDSEYRIYENLSAVLELGWIHLNLDEDSHDYRNREDENAWNAQLSIQYAF